MPLDAICLTAVAAELRRAVIGGKVDKIYQPTRDEVVLHMRTGQGNVRMLLSANPQHPRAHLTETPRENPDTPPMFCMLLRKYFLGGRILAITQPSMERLLEFQFETLSELGDRVERRLVLECIGRKANLIMLDGEGRITDCLRRVEGDLSARRPLMPGMFYQAPAPTGKLDPTAMTLEDLRRLVLEQAPEGEGQDKWLLDTFSGLSPLVARELEFQGAGSREGLSDRLERLLKAVKEECFQPIVLAEDEKPFDFTFMPVLQYGPSVELTAVRWFFSDAGRLLRPEGSAGAGQAAGTGLHPVRHAGQKPHGKEDRQSGAGSAQCGRPGADAPVRGHHHLQFPSDGAGTDRPPRPELLRSRGR